MSPIQCPKYLNEASKESALIPLFSLMTSGQIRLRRIDGWRKIATVLRQHTPVAA